jgi:hypothetical protein
VFLAPGVLLLVSGQAPDQDTYVLRNGKPCGLAGTAKEDGGKDLNRNKNRYHPPGADDIDPEVTLAAMLAPGDDVDRFDQKKAATVTGFVINVKVGGVETCNCKATDPLDRDTHIELALSKHAPETQRVIVEVTPRVRAQMAARHPAVDWTTETLRDRGAHGIKGTWVQVTGWLLFDDMHIDQAENTNPGNPSNWRATCWEIHPVTKITVLSGPPEDLVEVQPHVLAAFHAARAKQAARPATAAEIKKRHEAILAKYDKEEVEEERAAHQKHR